MAGAIVGNWRWCPFYTAQQNQSGIFKGQPNPRLNAILMRAQASLDGQRLDAGAQFTKLEWFPDKVGRLSVPRRKHRQFLCYKR